MTSIRRNQVCHLGPSSGTRRAALEPSQKTRMRAIYGATRLRSQQIAFSVKVLIGVIESSPGTTHVSWRYPGPDPARLPTCRWT
jgi:hypothetical protein